MASTSFTLLAGGWKNHNEKCLGKESANGISLFDITAQVQWLTDNRSYMVLLLKIILTSQTRGLCVLSLWSWNGFTQAPMQASTAIEEIIIGCQQFHIKFSEN